MDRQDNAQHLHLDGEPGRVTETVLPWPAHDLAHLREREAEKALDLLRGRECAPLPMGKAGSQEVEAREGDDRAVREGDGRPAGALEWRSLPFRPTMWQVISAQASGPPARVRAPS